MYGVALDMEPRHFTELKTQKRAILSGLISQWIGLPLLTFLLILVLRPGPGIALGMLMVAACPGGNVSNFFTQMAGGKVALSVTLTAIVSLTSFLSTPAIFFFYAGFLPATQGLIRSFELDFWDILVNISAILLLPLVLGMLSRRYFKAWSQKLGPLLRKLSMLILALFVLVALYNNRAVFLEKYDVVFSLVILHNALSMMMGYAWSRLINKDPAVHRTLAIETGIQNSGLGLVLIFTFLDGQAEMALIAAGWGVWHLIAGFFFAKMFGLPKNKVALA